MSGGCRGPAARERGSGAAQSPGPRRCPGSGVRPNVTGYGERRAMWQKRSRYLLALLTLALLGAGAGWVARTTTTASAAPAITGLHVSGNKIVNSAGQTVTLWGVNRSGGEFE